MIIEAPKNNQQNIDLSNAFDELEKKPEDEQQNGEEIFSPGTARMVKWLIKLSGGKIKSEKLANYILLAVAAVIFTISFFIFYSQMAPRTVSPSRALINPMQQNATPAPH
jgi:hypothetical protein